MATELTCEIHPRLVAVTPEEWQRLFPDLPDSAEMVQLIQRIGIDGFAFHSIVVRQGDRPILLLPLFETQYRLATLVGEKAQRLMAAIGRRVPALEQLRLLGVGFVEGEWGQVGVDPESDRATLDAAWDLALRTLGVLAKGLRTDLTAFVHFTTQSGRMLPLEKLGGFSQIAGPPFAQTPVAYAHPDDYIARLSPNMRSSLRRKLRKAQAVTVLRTRQPGPWLDSIYQFYWETYRRSSVNFSVHSREFFKSVCQRIDDAEYVLYFIGEQLAAFRLQIVRPDRLIDKYFGMDPVLGREYSLYFVSWFKDVEYCIANRIPLYHSGVTEEDTKERLGAQFVPSLILFRHRQPFLHGILSRLARHVAYQPTIALPAVRLGSDWHRRPATPPTVRQASSDEQTTPVIAEAERRRRWLDRIGLKTGIAMMKEHLRVGSREST